MCLLIRDLRLGSQLQDRLLNCCMFPCRRDYIIAQPAYSIEVICLGTPLFDHHLLMVYSTQFQTKRFHLVRLFDSRCQIFLIVTFPVMMPSLSSFDMGYGCLVNSVFFSYFFLTNLSTFKIT